MVSFCPKMVKWGFDRLLYKPQVETGLFKTGCNLKTESMFLNCEVWL